MEWKKLYFYLSDLKKINEDDFSLKEGVPINIFISSKIKPNCSKSSVLSSYLNSLKFPDGIRFLDLKRFKKTYLPLIKEKFTDKKELNLIQDKFTQEIFNIISLKNMDVKSREFSNSFNCIFSEIFNKIYSHSKANETILICQSLENGSMEFLIYDNGIGFKNSLKKETEIEALNSAVFKMESSTKNLERGRGLQTLKSFCLNKYSNGEFLVISNDSYSYMSKDKNGILKETKNLPFNIKGVCICLRINNLKEIDFKDIQEIMLYNLDNYLQENNLLD